MDAINYQKIANFLKYRGVNQNGLHVFEFFPPRKSLAEEVFETKSVEMKTKNRWNAARRLLNIEMGMAVKWDRDNGTDASVSEIMDALSHLPKTHMTKEEVCYMMLCASADLAEQYGLELLDYRGDTFEDVWGDKFEDWLYKGIVSTEKCITYFRWRSKEKKGVIEFHGDVTYQLDVSLYPAGKPYYSATVAIGQFRDSDWMVIGAGSDNYSAGGKALLNNVVRKIYEYDIVRH